MSRHGVTVQPIALQFGQVSSFSGPSVAGGGSSGGGGGAIVLLPLIASLFAPLLASGPAGPPTASPPTPPAAVGEAVPGGAAAPGGGAPAAAPGAPVVSPAPVVLTQGPTRTGVTARRLVVAPTPVHRARPPLPFTGENLWLPIVTGLQLIGIGAVLRYGLGAFGRGRKQS